MLKVVWPSQTATRAEAWRVLDLSGLTNNVRQSRNYTLAGYLYVNNEPVRSLRAQVDLGRKLYFELRFPNGVVHARSLFLVRPTHYKPRLNQPDTAYRKA